MKIFLEKLFKQFHKKSSYLQFIFSIGLFFLINQVNAEDNYKIIIYKAFMRATYKPPKESIFECMISFEELRKNYVLRKLYGGRRKAKIGPSERLREVLGIRKIETFYLGLTMHYKYKNERLDSNKDNFISFNNENYEFCIEYDSKTFLPVIYLKNTRSGKKKKFDEILKQNFFFKFTEEKINLQDIDYLDHDFIVEEIDSIIVDQIRHRIFIISTIPDKSDFFKIPSHRKFLDEYSNYRLIKLSIYQCNYLIF